ncbi:hypothetical protein ACRE_044110 [Hapsidospora chrysogenum ATCC 11550]|uniref:Perilipin-like protein n=1 Tax=Hapsidospora chrysogenum (strain ATCC 11550 / CBS 779.69 / DSM 880 / IAM 14645 / JCM 23072 / IMI 49137) TaxID=857340 RepID=A0A086T5Z6_HAPC1|nr:hypothetical protein ACRE_044110 [Hapsidospora chrysogenum ATCC 11550]
MSRQVNGELPNNAGPHSAFIQHLLDYPVISDGLHTFQTNEYGQRTLKIGDSAYKTLAAPILPLLSKPYQYVSPYVARADSFGDKALAQIDERFPAVKKPTGELLSETKGLILLPYNKAFEGRDHLFHVYSSEAKKNEQEGVLGYGKAAVTTALVVSSETLNWLGSFLRAKKADAGQAVSDKTNSH